MSETAERFKNYYGMNNTITNLYNKSGKRHNNLFRLVININNFKLALKKLGMNDGRNTAGPDGMTYNDLKNMDFSVLIREVHNRLHLKTRPKGRKVSIPKSNGGIRVLGITNILDRLAQQCVMNILEPIGESLFYNSSFGFRPNLQAQHCIATFNNSLWACVHQNYEYTVIDADLTKCFDMISLDKVLNTLKTEFNIHDKKFLGCIQGLMSISYGKEKYNGVGLAQGSILGPILCNILLHKLDKKMYNISKGHSKFKAIIKQGRREYKNRNYQDFREKYGDCFSIQYVRYADDFLIGCSFKEDAPILLNLIKNFLNEEIGVQLNLDKTSIVSMTKFGNTSIDFLGYKIKTTKGHIRISPKDFSKTCAIIKKDLDGALYKLHAKKYRSIYESCSIISGYINYFDICTNLEPLISFCNKRLYTRGYKRLGVLDKEVRKDVYHTKRTTVKGRTSTIDLYGLRQHTSLSYKDYIKVPYWKPSSDNEFLWVNQLQSYKESFKNIYLHGLLIRNPIDYITGINFKSILYIDIHHKLPVAQGGTDEFHNLIPLSKFSHDLVHCPKDKIKSYYNAKVKISLVKLNKLRKLANREVINANDLN